MDHVVYKDVKADEMGMLLTGRKKMTEANMATWMTGFLLRELYR